MTEVIVLNGGSSSGKSGIVRCLQAVLPDPWLALGTDTLVDAMPLIDGKHMKLDHSRAPVVEAIRSYRDHGHLSSCRRGTSRAAAWI